VPQPKQDKVLQRKLSSISPPVLKRFHY